MAEKNSSKMADVEFLFAFLEHHKKGAWDLKGFADKYGMPNAKAVENKLYTMKKKHLATTSAKGSSGDDQSSASPKPPKTPNKGSKTSKKRKLEDGDGDDEEVEHKPVKPEAEHKAVKPEAEGDAAWAEED